MDAPISICPICGKENKTWFKKCTDCRKKENKPSEQIGLSDTVIPHVENAASIADDVIEQFEEFDKNWFIDYPDYKGVLRQFLVKAIRRAAKKDMTV